MSAPLSSCGALPFDPGINLTFVPDGYAPAQPDRLRKLRIVFGKVPDMRARSPNLAADATDPEVASAFVIVMFLG
jgi:hypothetical protein